MYIPLYNTVYLGYREYTLWRRVYTLIPRYIPRCGTSKILIAVPRFSGAGVVVCWAMAASLVPLMAKGKDSARSAHIAFNLLGIGLFTWQLPTGWEIAQKVVQFTKFP